MTKLEAHRMTLEDFLVKSREVIQKAYPDIKKLELECVVESGRKERFEVYFSNVKSHELIYAVFYKLCPNDGMYIAKYKMTDWGLHTIE